MATITMERSYDAPVDVVWAVVTDHELYGEIAPNLSTVEVLDGEGEGMVRRCVDADGNAWTESCTRWEPGRAFVVAVDVENSEFHRRLFTRFEGRWQLTDREEDVLVTMSFEYDTRYGPLGVLVSRYFAYRAPSVVDPIFEGWAAAVESRVGEDTASAGEAGSPGGDVSPG